MRGMRSFREWKAVTISRLLELERKYRNNAEALETIDVILSKLEYAKARDLASVLMLFHHGSKVVPELLDL
ncbi:MAG: hypothetical protein DRJ96_07595, partial [Thermoprotei archaeon]